MPKAKETSPAERQIAAILQTIITLKDDKNLPNAEDVFPDDLAWRRANNIRRGDLTSLRDFTRSVLKDDATIQITMGPGTVKAVLYWSDKEKAAKGHAYASPNTAGDMGIAALEAIFSSKIADLQARTPRRQETRTIQETMQDVTVDENGVAQAAYVGMNGDLLRVLVPVEHIELESAKLEPRSTYRHTSASWDEADSYLAERHQKGDHSEFFFEVFFANGHSQAGNIDISGKDPILSLSEHIRTHLKSPEKLTTFDLEQPATIPAPDDWTVVWDFREKRCRDLEKRVYDAVAANTPTRGPLTP